jgi:Fic-DOC domain mobile mystery protein B
MSLLDPIPGATPIDDISGLKVKRISTRAELAKAEAENIRKAFVKYMAAKPSRKIAPFNFTWSLRLHEEMFGDVWTWAGQLRKIDLNFGVRWDQVEGQLFSLFKDLPQWGQNGMALSDQAVQLHHKAVFIHPFLNGNGRWSRLLANIWLKQNGAPEVQWPSDVGERSPVRREYLEAIHKADDGDLKPLTELHHRLTARA